MLSRIAMILIVIYGTSGIGQVMPSSSRESDYLAHERPIADYEVVQYKDIRFVYPLNWQVKTTESGWFIMGPKFGLLSNGIACGVTMGSFLTTDDFSSVSSRFISWVQQETPGGMKEIEPTSSLPIGGKTGQKWTFMSTSMLEAKDRQERNDVILVPLRKDKVWWIVLTSLLQDHDSLEPVFHKLLESIQFGHTEPQASAPREVIVRLSTAISTATNSSGDFFQADVVENAKQLRSVSGYIREIRPNQTKGEVELSILIDNLRSPSSSTWIVADIIGIRNSKGQRGVDENGTGIILQNSEIPLVTVASPDALFFSADGRITKNSVRVFSAKLHAAHLSGKSAKIILGKGAELVVRVSEPAP